MAATSIIAASKQRAQADRHEAEERQKRLNRRIELENQREDWYRSHPSDCRFSKAGSEPPLIGYSQSEREAYSEHLAAGLIEFVRRARNGDGFGRFDEIDYGDDDAAAVVREIYSLASKRRRKALAQSFTDLLECDKPLRDAIDNRFRKTVPYFLIHGPQLNEVDTSEQAQNGAADPKIPESELSKYHAPPKWAKANGVSATTWAKLRKQMRCYRHPQSGSQKTRFTIADLNRLGLVEPS